MKLVEIPLFIVDGNDDAEVPHWGETKGARRRNRLDLLDRAGAIETVRPSFSLQGGCIDAKLLCRPQALLHWIVPRLPYSVARVAARSTADR
jgi:hypothetical protein